MKIIDPHIHLFDLQKGQYTWLISQNAPFWPDKSLISRNFDEQNLNLPAPLQLCGFVHIEAGFDNSQPWREIEWLEQTCTLPFKSVACIDLTAPFDKFRSSLDKLCGFRSTIGVRHIFDEKALEILACDGLEDKFNSLADRDIHFELQMSINDTEAVDALMLLLQKVPNTRVVVNHAGFPPYALANECLNWRLWQDNLSKLATLPNIYIKCSGFEMTERDYGTPWQRNVVMACVELFGLHRVMMASNFPLCLFSTRYQDYWKNCLGLTEPQNFALMYKNAFDFYRFEQV